MVLSCAWLTYHSHWQWVAGPPDWHGFQAARAPLLGTSTALVTVSQDLPCGLATAEPELRPLPCCRSQTAPAHRRESARGELVLACGRSQSLTDTCSNVLFQCCLRHSSQASPTVIQIICLLLPFPTDALQFKAKGTSGDLNVASLQGGKVGYSKLARRQGRDLPCF